MDFWFIHEQEVMETIQTEVGCFECHKNIPDVDFHLRTHKSCYHCRFAIYCADCRSNHYSDGVVQCGASKKFLCSMVEGIQYNTPGGGNLLRFFAGVGYIDDARLELEMKRYSNELIDNIKKIQVVEKEQKRIKEENLWLIILCAEDYDAGNPVVRLIATADYNAGYTNHHVHNIMFKKVDTGRDAIAQIYPADGSMGEISDDKKEVVVTEIEDLVGRIKNNRMNVVEIQFGRGLTWLSSDEEAHRFEGISCKAQPSTGLRPILR